MSQSNSGARPIPSFPAPSIRGDSLDQSMDSIMKIVYDLTGNKLTDEHRGMIQSRLYGRQLELGLQSLDEYLKYFHSHKEVESPKLIALLTTHHTYFFREFAHFEYLLKTALPSIVPIARKRSDKTIRVWSAACSRGQEAYSLALCLDYFVKTEAPDLKYHILGSDIDQESVGIAQNGVYPKTETQSIPLQFIGTHIARGTAEIADFTKFRSSVKQNMSFRTGNLLAPKNFSDLEKFDIIFCRNVFIYFEKSQIASISRMLLSFLNPEGYFFIGVSESLNGLGLPIQKVGSSIFRHEALAIPASAKAIAKNQKARVVCVDDSPTIISMLKRILSPEHGFEIVGTAAHGKEAQELLKSLGPNAVDLVTLDIHMPEMGGVEYLAKNMSPNHPPVVMISSVHRDDSELALKSLKLGACDFVEKPSLSSLTERAEEIRIKLRAAATASVGIVGTIGGVGSKKNTISLAFDEEGSGKLQILSPELKEISILANYSQKRRVVELVKQLKSLGPKIRVILDTQPDLLSAQVGEIERDTSVKIAGECLNRGEGLKKSNPGLRAEVLLVLGDWTDETFRNISKWSGDRRGATVVLEETQNVAYKSTAWLHTPLRQPVTSFAYTALEALCKIR